MMWLQLLAGLVLLALGGRLLVQGATRMATLLRVSSVVVGVTVVAYGTSAPELFACGAAAIRGSSAIVLGNVIGSSIANIGLILGLAALMRPLTVHVALIRRESPFLLVLQILLPFLLWDALLRRWEGGLLLAAGVIYTILVARSALRQRGAAQQLHPEVLAGRSRGSIMFSGGVALLGIVLLSAGADQFVAGAIDLSRWIGVSERIIGLTVVAVGTSLPELATSLTAAARGESDICVSNVIGSNIFNLVMVLGITAIAYPVVVSPEDIVRTWIDLVVVFGMTAVLVVIVRRSPTVTRSEGAFLLALYAAYLVFLFLR
jgi:cation:H+ antiporter